MVELASLGKLGRMPRPHQLCTYPTDRTRPVSARFDSSWTPRILCSRIDDTSVGEAFASAAYVRVWRAETLGAAFRCRTSVSLAETPRGQRQNMSKIRQLLDKLSEVARRCCDAAKSSIELRGWSGEPLRLISGSGRRN